MLILLLFRVKPSGQPAGRWDSNKKRSNYGASTEWARIAAQRSTTYRRRVETGMFCFFFFLFSCSCLSVGGANAIHNQHGNWCTSYFIHIILCSCSSCRVKESKITEWSTCILLYITLILRTEYWSLRTYARFKAQPSPLLLMNSNSGQKVSPLQIAVG